MIYRRFDFGLFIALFFQETEFCNPMTAPAKPGCVWRCFGVVV
jgi:hypothetical protein